MGDNTMFQFMFGLLDSDTRRRLLPRGLRERDRQDAILERSFDLFRLSHTMSVSNCVDYGSSGERYNPPQYHEGGAGCA